ncbi:palmitoyltransferase ZDHHC19 isoform X3 [Cavia porcellus]|uniref:palmitoyltransferase ZDHHC19 isoform X3 n=1 Tax=Cavia porcellus TaxID=10141 RepID=UPI002FE0DCAC
MSHMKGPQSPPLTPVSWFLPSLFPAFNGVLLVVFSGLFFAFPCRWLAQNGEWAVPAVTGPLFLLTFFSLISLNFLDPGTLHQGSPEEDPMIVHVVWVNYKAFRLRWCPRCCFHRPPRTHHCSWCNICVEDFDHHCKWVNNCIGHRNFRFFMLLIVSLCLYSGALLVTSLLFLARTSHLPFNLDKAMALLVAIPAAGFLAPFLVLLVSQVLLVSTAERSYEGQGCTRNWYLTLCAPLGPQYMSDAVWLQRPVGPERVPTLAPNLPPCPCAHCHPPRPGTPPQPVGHCPGKGPLGGGEAGSLQEAADWLCAVGHSFPLCLAAHRPCVTLDAGDPWTSLSLPISLPSPAEPGAPIPTRHQPEPGQRLCVRLAHSPGGRAEATLFVIKLIPFMGLSALLCFYPRYQGLGAGTDCRAGQSPGIPRSLSSSSALAGSVSLGKMLNVSPICKMVQQCQAWGRMPVILALGD